MKPPLSVLVPGVLWLAGCATRADLLQQDRRVRALLQDTRRQVASVQREVERMRRDLEDAGIARKSGAPSTQDTVAGLQRRIDDLERELGRGTTPAGALPPEGTPAGAAPTPGEGMPPPPGATTEQAALPPPEPPPPPVDEWRREVTAEQASAKASGAAGNAEYAAILDGVAKKDCGRAVPQLNSFAAANRSSPLAGDAVYWAGRCYAATGKQEDAISKFYEVGTRYPRSGKAPAALWAQGTLFLRMGNTPDARLVFSKLIREYPRSDEAARARQKIAELDQ